MEYEECHSSEQTNQKTTLLPVKTPRRNVVIRHRTAPAVLTPVKTARPVVPAGIAEFSPAFLETIAVPPSPIRLWTALALVGVFATALMWSYFGTITVYTDAPGKIQAIGRTKVIEPRETSQIKSIRVRDGDQVNEGDVLIELDPTNAIADQTILTDKIVSFRAESARRRVEMAAARADEVNPNVTIAWDSSIPLRVRDREAAVLRSDLTELAATLGTLGAQRKQKEAERDRFADSIAAEKDLMSVISEHVDMRVELEAKGWNSRSAVLTAEKLLKEAQIELTTLEGNHADAAAAIHVIDEQIAKTIESFVTNDVQLLAAADRQIAELEQQLVKATQQVKNMTLRAPISGTIAASAVTTIGQVVKPSQQLMQIVPGGKELEILAYVPNQDIGLIKNGQSADIRVDTFPYEIYGMIPGTVTNVAAAALPAMGKNKPQPASLDGTVSQTTAAERTGNIMFPITVEARRATMNIDGKEIPLSPGMTVSVDLKTEDRRAIDYLLSPLIDLFSTSAHER